MPNTARVGPHQRSNRFSQINTPLQSSSEYSGPAIKHSPSSPLRLRNEGNSKLIGKEMRRGNDGLAREDGAADGVPFLEGSQDAFVCVRAPFRVVVEGTTY